MRPETRGVQTAAPEPHWPPEAVAEAGQPNSLRVGVNKAPQAEARASLPGQRRTGQCHRLPVLCLDGAPLAAASTAGST